MVDPDINKVYVSQDAVFEETESWPWDKQGKSSTSREASTFVVYGYSDDREEQNANFDKHTQTSEASEDSQNSVIADSSEMHQSMSQTGGNEKDGYSQQSARSSSGAELSDSSSEPQNYRSLINIYNTTDEI